MQIVINTRGTRLHKDGERFLIQAGEKKLSLSAQKIQSIVLATAATITTDTIGLAVANNIDIIFLDKFGDPISLRIWPRRLGSTAAIRSASARNRRRAEYSHANQARPCGRATMTRVA